MADDEKAVNSMHKRRILLADGRYMIFYTFDPDALRSPEARPSVPPESPIPEPAKRENV